MFFLLALAEPCNNPAEAANFHRLTERVIALKRGETGDRPQIINDLLELAKRRQAEGCQVIADTIFDTTLSSFPETASRVALARSQPGPRSR